MTPSYNIYRPIVTPDDSNIIQCDLDLLVDLCKVWEMDFNLININTCLLA